MRVGKEDAERLLLRTDGVSKQEERLMKKWKKKGTEPKVTTLRVYPDTIEQVREFAKSNYQIIPEYVVMDHVLKLGIRTAKSERNK